MLRCKFLEHELICCIILETIGRNYVAQYPFTCGTAVDQSLPPQRSGSVPSPGRAGPPGSPLSLIGSGALVCPPLSPQ